MLLVDIADPRALCGRDDKLRALCGRDMSRDVYAKSARVFDMWSRFEVRREGEEGRRVVVRHGRFGDLWE